MFRSVCRTSGFLMAVALLATPASAQVVQSFHVSFGGFFPRGFESRVAGDTIAEDSGADDDRSRARVRIVQSQLVTELQRQ